MHTTFSFCRKVAHSNRTAGWSKFCQRRLQESAVLSDGSLHTSASRDMQLSITVQQLDSQKRMHDDVEQCNHELRAEVHSLTVALKQQEQVGHVLCLL